MKGHNERGITRWNNIYKQCIKCSKAMHGIRDENHIRDKCQDCGGNGTKYNEKKPHPKSHFATKKENK